MGRIRKLPRWLQISYQDKRIVSYMVAGLVIAYGTILYGLMGAQSFGKLLLDDGNCPSISYVYSLELPLLSILLVLYYSVTFAFIWGVWRENARYILPFFCLLVATIGFIGHAHVERMLFEVNEDERRFVIVAFIFNTGVLIFASAITLLLYREMHRRHRKLSKDSMLLPSDKMEYLELNFANSSSSRMDPGDKR
ncbi:uncharacterized protein LOC129757236 [Uranotaenia lowii]|uniref:uncharacterized protein LOC129757236 n=1 Tax=Uranotaenia lowii TaxID=190385 RepID=UPI002479E465|nr:uncharacterized protein LOC129757236 [Uranotaenia lowii]